MIRAPRPHITHQDTRHGKRLYYFRVNKGPRTPLPLPYMGEAFIKAYDLAYARHLGVKAEAETKTHSVAWLIDCYMGNKKTDIEPSAAWKAQALETRKQLKYQLTRIKARAGTADLTEITTAVVIDGRDERSPTPSDANKFVNAVRKLFEFGKDRSLVDHNPALGVAKVKLPNRAIGFVAWTEADAHAFETRWALGTRERLAFDLLVYTGVRRGDVVLLGRQHIKQDPVRGKFITIRTQKSINMGKPVAIAVTLLPPLAKSILTTKTGDLSFLVTAKGTAFAKESFGTWFKAACVAAGVEGTAHGIRKIAAIRCVKNGATEADLNAMFGWADGSSESATYIRNNNREQQALAASAKLIPKPDNVLPQTPSNILK